MRILTFISMVNLSSLFNPLNDKCECGDVYKVYDKL